MSATTKDALSSTRTTPSCGTSSKLLVVSALALGVGLGLAARGPRPVRREVFMGAR